MSHEANTPGPWLPKRSEGTLGRPPEVGRETNSLDTTAALHHDAAQEPTPMNTADALEQLTKAWPGAACSITLDVWSHLNPGGGRKAPVIEWSVYNAKTRRTYSHRTIEGAVDLAVNGLPGVIANELDTARELRRYREDNL